MNEFEANLRSLRDQLAQFEARRAQPPEYVPKPRTAEELLNGTYTLRDPAQEDIMKMQGERNLDTCLFNIIHGNRALVRVEAIAARVNEEDLQQE